LSDDKRLLALGVGGGDKLQSLALVIPCYVNVPTTFFGRMLGIVADYPERIRVEVMKSPYVAQAMRSAVTALLEEPEWERLVIIEQDMVLPRDALLKHACHTDDIVGSVYFQHAPPYLLNVMFKDPEGDRGWGHPAPDVVRMMLEKPALYQCDVVGLGLTSIARRVFEQWDRDIPFFRTDYDHRARDQNTEGEVSHDVWFCLRAREQGFGVWLDTSIRCDHLTEGATTHNHYAAAHASHFQKRIHLPPRNQESHAARLVKSH